MLRPDQDNGMHDCYSGSNSVALEFAKKNKSGPEWDTCVQNSSLTVHLGEFEFCIYIYIVYTGSSRKNGKSKTVCTGILFHKSWVFSAVLGPELATNLSSTAPRSTTFTRRHPKKLAYPKCFQALGG